MNVLIVGGTGVISYAVVTEALKCGMNVTCINRGKNKTQKLNSKVKVIIADYRNYNQIKALLIDKTYDVVIDVLCFKKEDIIYSVNLFKDHCKQYIFFSSCAVYNKGKGDYECTEGSQLVNPLWSYSVRKVECENELKKIAKNTNLVYTIVRPAVTYGNTRIPYGITPPYGYHGTIIQRILNRKPIILWDNGEAYSTITRVEDFAIGLVGLFGNTKAYNQEFHIVGNERYRWIDVINCLGNILGVEPIFFNLTKETLAKEMPSRKGEILGGRGISQLLDNSKLKTCVPNFKTTIPLEKGLKMTVDYYMQNSYLLGIDYSFEGEWDRIIKKHAKVQKIEYDLKFVDYFKENKISNYCNYYLSFHNRNKLIKYYRKLKKTIVNILK
jgi:Nucleoside-diphosphate-sugar epimerases